MSETTTLASAGTTPGPKVETPKVLPFWVAIVTGPGGLPDEAAFAYLYVAQPLIALAFLYNGFTSHHFALLDLAGVETALNAVYQAVLRVRNGAV